MDSVQREAALRIASAYHTVSLVQGVASVIPSDLLALERKYIYDSVDEREVTFTRARSDSMNAWQNRWKKGQTGRWTYRLIPDLRAWTERQHGEVDYYLTQFLTGHGYFRGLLKEWQKVATGQCLHCPGVKDSAEAPALPELESRGSGPGNATESRKLGQSSRVRKGHFVSKEVGGLSIVESSPVPRQGGKRRPAA